VILPANFLKEKEEMKLKVYNKTINGLFCKTFLTTENLLKNRKGHVALKHLSMMETVVS
jgi:hypothetical protein